MLQTFPFVSFSVALMWPDYKLMLWDFRRVNKHSLWSQARLHSEYEPSNSVQFKW